MIKDFNFYAPTRVVFGRESEEKLPELIKQYGGTKVLVHFGGDSARRSGLLDKVEQMLDGAAIAYIELGGVVPNPLLSKVREGIELCKREDVDFILAVGGGSVIDSAKAIGYGVGYEGDVWDFWDGKAVPQSCLPIGVMLTIPAAGSEMSSSCVITNDEGMLKRGVNSDLCRCKFAIMNPERTFTLPEYQTAAGGVDILMHTMERYFSKYEDAVLTDALAEALMRTVIEALPEVLFDPENYKYRAAIMWASSLSHNDLMECGTEKDFACHKLEHELSGMFGVTHGAGLAAIWSSWAYYVMDKHLSRFVKFAVNVMGVPQDFTDPRETAMRGIRALEDFFLSIDMPVSIDGVLDRRLTVEEIDALVDKCSRGGKMNIGAMEVLTPEDMRKIYKKANE